MNRKVLLFGLIATMSMCGLTQLVAANYYGTVPTDRLLADTGCFNWDTWENDEDCDGVPDSQDQCVNVPGDAEHCGCPENLASPMGPDGKCDMINDPDNPNNKNDSGGVPVGGGLLILLGSALIYGATLKRRNRIIENNN